MLSLGGLGAANEGFQTTDNTDVVPDNVTNDVAGVIHHARAGQQVTVNHHTDQTLAYANSTVPCAFTGHAVASG